MDWVNLATERTTAATDGILGILALFCAAYLLRHRSKNPEKIRWWSGMFFSLSLASGLGAAAHGLVWTASTLATIWLVLNALLALTIALLALAVFTDYLSDSLPRWAIAVVLLSSTIFYIVTLFFPDSFLVFVLYEAVVMLWALFVYVNLAVQRKMLGAYWMTFGILVTITAAVIQGMGPFQVDVLWVFDHNGVFHIVQLIGCLLLAAGIRISLNRKTGV